MLVFMAEVEIPKTHLGWPPKPELSHMMEINVQHIIRLADASCNFI